MNVRLFALLGMTVLGLTACQVQETLSGGSPDEFRVTKHEPLKVPPSLILRDPKELTVAEKAITPVKTAHDILSGTEVPKVRELTASDQALLHKAHVGKASPTLRRELEQENRKIVAESRRSLFGSKKGRGKIIDPVAEQKRLDELKKKGTDQYGGHPAIYDRGSDNPSDNL